MRLIKFRGKTESGEGLWSIGHECSLSTVYLLNEIESVKASLTVLLDCYPED